MHVSEKYRNQKMSEIANRTGIVTPAITRAFPELWKLGEKLKSVDDRIPVRIETPFGDFIFHPSTKPIEQIEKSIEQLDNL